MGTSESKIAVASTPKPAAIQRLKNQHLAQLADPRSPSCEITRTPIQVSGEASAGKEVQETIGPVFVDPRSPTVGIVRTPLKDSVKVTVSSLAKRLSTFFLNDVTVGDSASTLHPSVSFTKQQGLPSVEQQDEQSSKDPLLPPRICDALDVPANCPATPADFSSSVGYGSFCSSPFVVVGEAQPEDGAYTDTIIDEAEEAVFLGEGSLKRELSLSLLGCREGVYSPEFRLSTEGRPNTPLPTSVDGQVVDHACALPFINHKPELSACASEATSPPLEQKSAVTTTPPKQSQKQPEKIKLPICAPASSEVLPLAVTFPRFDARSPSQAVFKPQWLGIGFGATGVRSRSVQNRARGQSSPLSTRRAATDENENKVMLNKQKQRGKSLIGEGRSPLQVLRETNSPRINTTQMNLKVSTPEKQRFGQMDRRALVLSLNKENR